MKTSISILITSAIFLTAFAAPCYICPGTNEASAAASKTNAGETLYLSTDQHDIVLISALAAKGNLQQLNHAIRNGLDAGLAVNEIKEVMVHLYAYCGFPRSIRGLNTLMAVLEERKAEGITDEMGPDASPITDERSKYERGVETLYELTGEEWGNPQSGYGAFAPVMDRFLKEHLFADIFERDVLTYQQRELVTISALSSMGGVEPMLGGHMGIALNIGIDEMALQQIFAHIEHSIGKKEADKGRAILGEVVASKRK